VVRTSVSHTRRDELARLIPSARFGISLETKSQCVNSGCAMNAVKEMIASFCTNTILTKCHPASSEVSSVFFWKFEPYKFLWMFPTFVIYCLLTGDLAVLVDCSRKEECPYQHIDPESAVPDCPWFARGYCDKGSWSTPILSPYASYLILFARIRMSSSYVCSCLPGRECKARHRKLVACPNYITGFCPLGPMCERAQYVFVFFHLSN
jgi:hypothetical protein